LFKVVEPAKTVMWRLTDFMCDLRLSHHFRGLISGLSLGFKP
jgi:hypothetical protein